MSAVSISRGKEGQGKIANVEINAASPTADGGRANESGRVTPYGKKTVESASR